MRLRGKRRPRYEQVVPDRIRALAEGVGLPRPTWYEGRTKPVAQIEGGIK